MTRTAISNGLIVDANVLIDYAKSGPNILKLASKHIQQLYVALSVLDEVKDLSRSDIEKLGLETVEPSFAQLIEATELRQAKPTLSGQDAICFILAKEHEWICLTNDKPLRSLCFERGVDCLWGLEIMIQLVATQKLTTQKAHGIALDMQSKNTFIKADIINRFRDKLRLIWESITAKSRGPGKTVAFYGDFALRIHCQRSQTDPPKDASKDDRHKPH